MDTRPLKLFTAIARLGSLSKAAKEIHLTPSALSHGLKCLENELGCRLFDRVGKRLVLNQAGEQLLSQVEGPLAALDNAAASVRALARWGQGRLRVGATVTACQHILPPALRELRKDFSKLQLIVESGDASHLVQLLRDNRIDLLIAVEPEYAPDMETRALFEDELLLVLSSSHPWADGRPLSKEELAKQPLILYQRTSPTARLVNQYFRDQAIEPSSIMEIASITAIKEMVKLNLGVSFLAPWAADQELSKGSLKMRPLGPKALRRRWVMAHDTKRRLGLAEERFFKLCRAQCTSMRLDRRDLPEAGRVKPK